MPPKKRRQRSGWGTTRKRTNGRFTAEYTGPDAQRHSAGRSFSTEMDARAWLALEHRLIELGTWTPPAQRRNEARALAETNRAQQMTVGELVEDWLARSTAITKESVRRSHRRRLALRAIGDDLPPRVGSLKDVRVVDVDRDRVRLWIDQMNAQWPEGAGYSTSYYARKRLVTAFAWAKDELGLIDENPVARVTMKRPQTKNADEPVFTREEVRIITAAFPDWLRHAPEILFWCGLRLGELLELRVKDVSGLKNGEVMTLKIRRNMIDVDRENGHGKEVLISDTPKSAAGRRDIIVPEWVADSIRRHLEESGKIGDPEALVVSRRNGYQFTEHNFRNYYFRPAAETAGRKHNSTVHSTRRFYGTNLVRLVMAGNISMEEARRLMGHETVAQLMEYQRAEVGYQERAASVLNGLKP